jgi:hypothetical protein
MHCALACTVLAAGGGPSGVEVLLGFLFILIILVAAALRGPARYDVIIKSGAPYCPRCNRQVSYRRTCCRACGYEFVSYGPSPEEVRQQDEAFREQLQRDEAKRQKWLEHQEAERAERRERDRAVLRWVFGLGWYKAMPEWAQPIVLGVAISVPIVLLLGVCAAWFR